LQIKIIIESLKYLELDNNKSMTWQDFWHVVRKVIWEKHRDSDSYQHERRKTTLMS
jgi:hypothetical protein